MAKSAGYWVNDHDRRVRALAEAWAVVKRRLVEALGFALLLVCLLLILTLLTYDARDGSLNTAVDSTPRNFLGHDGAVLADLLWQSLGLASFLIPILLLAWSFRLLLNRPIRSTWPRLALLPLILVLGALALSILDLGALSPPAGPGGALGWGLQRLLARSGLGAAAAGRSVLQLAATGATLVEERRGGVLAGQRLRPSAAQQRHRRGRHERCRVWRERRVE